MKLYKNNISYVKTSVHSPLRSCVCSRGRARGTWRSDMSKGRNRRSAYKSVTIRDAARASPQGTSDDVERNPWTIYFPTRWTPRWNLINQHDSNQSIGHQSKHINQSPKVLSAQTYVETSRAEMESSGSFARDVRRRPLTQVGRRTASSTTPKWMVK